MTIAMSQEYMIWYVEDRISLAVGISKAYMQKAISVQFLCSNRD